MWAGDWWVWERLCWKDPESPGAQWDVHEPAVYHDSKEGQEHRRLCEQDTASSLRKVIVLLYWVLVRPHLEYSFAHQYKKDTAKLGQVQQRAPKIVRAGALALWAEAGGSWACLAWSRSGFRGTYELAASTQQEVRQRLFIAVRGGRMCNSSRKLKWERSRLNTRKHFFSPVRTVKQWNCL